MFEELCEATPTLNARNNRLIPHDQSQYLKDHLVRLVALPQAPCALEVLGEESLLLDGLEESLIHLLLVRRPVRAGLLLLALALVEERILAALLVRLLVPRKVLWLADLVYGCLVEAVDSNSGRGGDDIASVDAPDGDAVDFERAGYEENALVEDFEEDDTLAAEAAGEKDEDGTGLEG